MSHGFVFNIQRFSLDDGTGIRTCVFLKGCPLRCVWCHNAESLSPKREIAFYARTCIGCGSCAATCPQNAISLCDGKAFLDRKRCVACGACAEVCCSGALTSFGKSMSTDEVMRVVKRDIPFYQASGGMTVTGGEPLSQSEFTLSLLQAAKREGISTAVETSGYGDTAALLSLVPYCDLFLFDCKASSERHRALTGVDDRIITDNLFALCRVGAKIVLRCPIVVGGNLNQAFLDKIAELALSRSAISYIQLMPYHRTGASKSEAIGKPAQEVFDTPSAGECQAIVRYLQEQARKPALY